jgi:formylglycine-generating enzyme required for sulfatase activity
MTFESLPSTSRIELDAVCDAFEEAWKTGLQPRIEERVCDRTEPERTILFQMLLAVELEQRRKAGDTPRRDEYLERFEAYTEVIHTVLDEERPGDVLAAAQLPATDAMADFTPPADLGTTLSMPFGGPRQPADPASWTIPERIGRYAVIRELGRGNFVVYRARDDRDGRDVAIKVARPDNPTGRLRLMSLADEAEKIKALQHPRVVKLYEYVPAGGSGAGADGYIVLEYVEGRDGERTLEELLRAGPVPVLRLIRVIALVAETLHYAHTHASYVVHRDVKPSNILLDAQGEPRVCDFGLAVDEEIQRLQRGEVAGTPPYMAPEQVRGETHRLDGRTDIWALGVILYRGLTGRFPFPGPDREQIFDEILHRDPRPLRMYDSAIEPELERICLRCLSRPMCERYLTASDLAADLKRVVDELPPPAHPVESIVYKGLRPFDVEDARFFLELLPGPRRGDGMPESLRFWKDRVEAFEGAKAFSVGVLFGPSGGGKSSFVRAGLLPNLDRGRVRPVYIEATPSGTEARLLAELRRAVPGLPSGVNLPDAVAILRDDTGLRPAAKLFIVLDQFEQWLQSHPDEPDAELVRALRQCDGRRVAALVLVRDDFWMAVTRFLRAVDIPLVQGGNAAAVELLDARHTRKVLEGFGKALGQLPEAEGAATEESERFFAEAVSGLTDSDARVVPMRLSLFTEVVRNRPWTPETLRALGGVDGIGVKFLDDCFAKPEYSHYANAAKKVLKKLLPPPTSAIRGKPCGSGELRLEAGYAEQPDEFADLVRVLAGELRLVTVAETGGQAPGPERAVPAGETRYQLAHDSLVRPIRTWLEREQGSTRIGRAQLRLALVTASWLQRPGSRQLPSLLEWVGILRHIPRREWKTDERRLMFATARHYLTRGALALAVLAALALGFVSIREGDRARERDRARVFQQAIAADAGTLRGLLPELAAQRGWLRPRLELVAGDALAADHYRANAVLLLHREQPTPERALGLRARLEKAGPDEVALIRDTLATDPATARGDLLLGTLRDNSATDATRLRAACALVGLGPVENEVWTPVAGDLVRGLLHGEDRRTHPHWLEMLGPAPPIIESLRNVCADPGSDPVTRITAAEALAVTLSTQHDAAGLANALTIAQPEASLILLRKLELLSDKQGGLKYLEAIASDQGKPRDDPAVSRQSMATIALAVLGQPDALRAALRHQIDPGLRTWTIQRIAILKLAPRVLHERLPWPELDGAQRQAVLLAWAETPRDAILPSIRAGVLATARQSFSDDSDPGIHSACELLFSRWKLDAPPVMPAGTRKLPGKGAGNRGWEEGPNGHTFAILSGPFEYWMGSPEGENGRSESEQRHYRRVERSIAVATTEVTAEQFLTYKRGYKPHGRATGEPGPVANGISWYDAAGYCNWLSELAEIPPEQWCYPKEIKRAVKIEAAALARYGYRLPTEAEWEYFSRAGTDTSRFFGGADTFLSRYAWTWLNSKDRTYPPAQLLPNEFGLFDTLGNVLEWCQNGPTDVRHAYQDPYPSGTLEQPAHDVIPDVPAQAQDDQVWHYLRGASYEDSPYKARAAFRDEGPPDDAKTRWGFRVVRTLPRNGR